MRQHRALGSGRDPVPPSRARSALITISITTSTATQNRLLGVADLAKV
jgi:hypothetical protein